MNDYFEQALARRVALLADPLDDSDWSDVQKRARGTAEAILVWGSNLGRAAHDFAGTGKRRRLVLVGAVGVAAAITGMSVAATKWLVGAPAPAPVVSDFKAYTPQLGFHPEPGKAVFVAQDGAIKLYATTNREGTYCLVVDEPWKHADAGDGGTCVSKTWAGYPITAGLLGAASGEWVVGGRVDDGRAREIRFTSPSNEEIKRPIGASGFFVAAVHTAAGCPKEDWEPTFSASDSNDRELVKARILLEQVDRFGCGGAVGPHGPYAKRP